MTHLVKSPRVRARVALGEVPAGSEGLVETVLGTNHEMVVMFDGLGRRTCRFGDLVPTGGVPKKPAPTARSRRRRSRG